MNSNFIKCPKCKKSIPVNSNYCYLCGEPISALAIENEKIKAQNAQLEILGILSKNINNKEVLEVIQRLAESMQ